MNLEWISATVSSPLHLLRFLQALFHGAQSKRPDQSLFALRQGVEFSGRPAEIIEAVVGCQNIDIPEVSRDQFFASSSGSVSRPDSSLMAEMSLKNSPDSSILPGT